jgi:hypothetical protein
VQLGKFLLNPVQSVLKLLVAGQGVFHEFAGVIARRATGFASRFGQLLGEVFFVLSPTEFDAGDGLVIGIHGRSSMNKGKSG